MRSGFALSARSRKIVWPVTGLVVNWLLPGINDSHDPTMSSSYALLCSGVVSRVRSRMVADYVATMGSWRAAAADSRCWLSAGHACTAQNGAH